VQIITRANLLAVLTGTTMDPEQEFQEEMTAFATAILAHAPAAVQHFVYTDHENGDDPVVSWGEYAQTKSVELLGNGEVYNARGDSYYGCTAQTHDWQYAAGVTPIEDTRVLYHCYLGGSPLNSAPGFVISTALLLS
jgi:hypothetical protein